MIMLWDAVIVAAVALGLFFFGLGVGFYCGLVAGRRHVVDALIGQVSPGRSLTDEELSLLRQAWMDDADDPPPTPPILRDPGRAIREGGRR